MYFNVEGFFYHLEKKLINLLLRGQDWSLLIFSACNGIKIYESFSNYRDIKMLLCHMPSFNCFPIAQFKIWQIIYQITKISNTHESLSFWLF